MCDCADDFSESREFFAQFHVNIEIDGFLLPYGLLYNKIERT